MRYRYIITICLLLFHFCVNSQSGKLFTVDNELSSSLINHIYQDHNKIIWIATQDGLNRYDGSKFTIYRKNKNDSTSLLHNYVRVVYQDRSNYLFIGFFNGLQVYQYDTDSFIEIPLVLENRSTYPSHVTSIIQRRNGDVLIGTTGHGVFILKREGIRLWADQQPDLVPSYLISFIYEDVQQNLWVGTQDKGLFLVDNEKRIKNFFAGDGESIRGICEDLNGTLYVGSDTKGLYSFNNISQTFSTTPSKKQIPLAINTLRKNSAGDILIGTEGNGLKIFNPQNGEISEGNFNIDTFDFSKSKVHAVMEDESGNIWLGIYQKGVILLPVKNNKFEYYGHKSIKNDIIGSNNVTALYKDQAGSLWVGTDGDGIYKVDKKANRTIHFEPSSGSTGTPSSIFSIFEDSQHTLWIGSYDRGICKLNTVSGKCDYVNNLLIDSTNQPLRVFGIVEDKNKNLWIATLGSGLYSFNLNSQRVNHYTALVGNQYRPESNVLNNDWIESILLTRDEKLFIGTMDGIGCLDLNSHQFTSTFGGHNRILPGTPIHALYEDSSNTIWVGTSDGVVSIQKTEGSPTITHYTTDNGLPSNEVHGILEDSLGSLWFSTSYGITRFNLKNLTFLNYNSGDGLQGNEFTAAAAISNDGDLVFGGINGITLFNPKEIANDVKKLNVSVTGFYIHNQPVKKGMKSGNYDIIESSVFDAGTFHLDHTDNSFSIEFSAMAFSNPERITYLYSLDDDDWITLRPGAGHVTFNNLAPGEYTFKVKAKDYNNYSEAKTIHIIIHPAWYFSFWAKCAYVFVLLAVAFIITQQIRQRQQTKRKMLEHIHAQQIIEAKLQFFINIAHEIRTPMTLIISPLKKLMTKDKDRERKRSYFLMNRNSERILHLINQLMDIQKIDKGQMTLRFQETEMVEYISDLCHVFDEQTVGKQIKLQYLHDMDRLPAFIDPNNFDKVILNVLSNALNFTPDLGTVTVSLSVGHNEKSVTTPIQNYFQITIADTGTGIPHAELEKVFECFYQTREKKRSSTGTGIGLYLTRSIVELHHGNIRAQNNQDGPGCKFIIQLPLGADHLASDQLVSDRSASGIKKELFTEALPSIEEFSESKLKVKSKYRILVADDDGDIRKYICDEMASEFHMIECCNGKEALSSALKNTPDLIISDIMMPEMDGITLCQKIKQNVNINQVPVILLTAKAEEEDNLEGLGIGADAYIVKPFNIELLRVTVQNIIKNRHILKNNFAGNQHQNDKVADVSVVSSDEKLLSRIMETISTNIDNPALNVEMLSREVGISRVHLHRKLKELTNQTTRDLIRNIRLQQAAKLLSEKQLNISEVAFAVGFTNVAHFSSAFKEFYGVPPTIYMESQLNDQIKKQRPLS